MSKKLPALCFLFLGLPTHHCSNLKNVLFLVVDDLRPELNPYYSAGNQLYPKMHTPNIDALADKSLLMKQAHVQLPLCGPSRTSFMTGRRPDTTKVYDLQTYWRTEAGEFETIPEHFKLNGYNTAGMGKIFHSGSSSGNDDDSPSWTEPFFHGVSNHEGKQNSWAAVTQRQLNRKDLIDKQIADQAISTLQNFSTDALSGTANFFVAVGFRKPHLPFVFPQTIMDTYYPEEDIFLPTNPYVPVGMPDTAWKSWGELRVYKDISDLGVDGSQNNLLPNDTVLQLRRGYYSAVTWVDEQVGRVLDELVNLGLENDTIISLHGDHGFLLGEHGGWCKETLFELATHTPMMIHIPGLTDNGVVTEQLAEFVDLFPTLVSAAGLESLDLCPEDSSNITNCTEGLSLLPLISNPETAIRKASFSQQPRRNIMGYSIRTPAFRYTEWVDFDYSTYEADWSVLHGQELYDLTLDPEENTNVASDPNYVENVAALHDDLMQGWRNAIIES